MLSAAVPWPPRSQKTPRALLLLPSQRLHPWWAASVLHREFFKRAVLILGFPGGSDHKESACSDEDPGLIPGLGRSLGERKGYQLQYFWAFLVAQVVKNLPAMQETWVQSLGWEDPLEKGKATHSNILAWRIPWTV